MKKFAWAASVVVLAACGGTTTVIHDPPSAQVAAPAGQNIIVNNNPAPSPSVSTVYVPPSTITDSNGNVCLSLDVAGYCPGFDHAPTYTPPSTPDPYVVVSSFFSYLSAGDYSSAYALTNGWPGDYSTWVAGYANTGSQYITENSESGDTVSINLTAYDTATFTDQHYGCTYTVDAGAITAGSCTQYS